jgi:hypothetical protein
LILGAFGATSTSLPLPKRQPLDEYNKDVYLTPFYSSSPIFSPSDPPPLSSILAAVMAMRIKISKTTPLYAAIRKRATRGSEITFSDLSPPALTTPSIKAPYKRRSKGGHHTRKVSLSCYAQGSKNGKEHTRVEVTEKWAHAKAKEILSKATSSHGREEDDCLFYKEKTGRRGAATSASELSRPSGPCSAWIERKEERKKRYVNVRVRGSSNSFTKAHRLVALDHAGFPPNSEELVVRHTCTNKGGRCINPRHLELGVVAVNVTDATRVRRENWEEDY